MLSPKYHCWHKHDELVVVGRIADGHCKLGLGSSCYARASSCMPAMCVLLRGLSQRDTAVPNCVAARRVPPLPPLPALCTPGRVHLHSARGALVLAVFQIL